MKRLIKAILIVGTSQVATSAVGILRNKLLAVLLGPAGVGLFAQLWQVQIVAASLVPMGMNLGALRFIAKYRQDDPQLLTRFVSTAARLFLLISLIVTAACLVFVRPLAGWALDTPRLCLYLVPPILGIPFLVQSQLWQVYLQAGLEIKAYSKALVVTSVLGLIVVAPLVYVWKQSGAAMHLLIFAIISYAIARIYAGRSMAHSMAPGAKRSYFDGRMIWDLFRYGAANFPIFAFDLLVPFLVRTQIINDVGLRANGIFQAVYVISTQYMTMPLTAMTTYSFPRISRLTDIKDINTEVNNGLKAALLFSTLGILVILPTRDLVVRLLFSSEFLAVVGLFPMQMIGQLLKTVVWTLHLPLVPQERFRARLVLAAINNGVFLGVFYAVPAHARLQGAVLAYLVAWAVNLVTMYAYVNRVNGYTFGKSNRRLMATTCAAVVVSAFLPLGGVMWRLASAGVLVAWIVTSVSREDFDKLRSAVRKRMSRPNDAEEQIN